MNLSTINEAKRIKKFNKFKNKIRTNLLKIADEEFRTHMKKSTMLINSYPVQDIINFYELHYVVNFDEEINAIKSKQSCAKANLNNSTFKDSHKLNPCEYEKKYGAKIEGLVGRKINVAKKKLETNMQKLMHNPDFENFNLEQSNYNEKNEKSKEKSNDKIFMPNLTINKTNSRSKEQVDNAQGVLKPELYLDKKPNNKEEIKNVKESITYSPMTKYSKVINDSLNKIHRICFGRAKRKEIRNGSLAEYNAEIMDILECKGVDLPESKNKNDSMTSAKNLVKINNTNNDNSKETSNTGVSSKRNSAEKVEPQTQEIIIDKIEKIKESPIKPVKPIEVIPLNYDDIFGNNNNADDNKDKTNSGEFIFNLTIDNTVSCERKYTGVSNILFDFKPQSHESFEGNQSNFNSGLLPMTMEIKKSKSGLYGNDISNTRNKDFYNNNNFLNFNNLKNTVPTFNYVDETGTDNINFDENLVDYSNNSNNNNNNNNNINNINNNSNNYNHNNMNNEKSYGQNNKYSVYDKQNKLFDIDEIKLDETEHDFSKIKLDSFYDKDASFYIKEGLVFSFPNHSEKDFTSIEISDLKHDNKDLKDKESSQNKSEYLSIDRNSNIEDNNDNKSDSSVSSTSLELNMEEINKTSKKSQYEHLGKKHHLHTYTNTNTAKGLD